MIVRRKGVLTHLLEDYTGITGVMGSTPAHAWLYFSGLIFTTASAVFLTAKISLIFTSHICLRITNEQSKISVDNDYDGEFR